MAPTGRRRTTETAGGDPDRIEDAPVGGADVGDPAREAWAAVMDLFLGTELHDRLHAACDEIGLPHPGSLKALMLLPDDDAPSMREMADVLGCDPSYVTALTDALEHHGYAARQVSATDRRVKLLHLTDAGIEARGRAWSVMSEPPPALASLPPDALTELARLLRAIGAGSAGR